MSKTDNAAGQEAKAGAVQETSEAPRPAAPSAVEEVEAWLHAHSHEFKKRLAEELNGEPHAQT